MEKCVQIPNSLHGLIDGRHFSSSLKCIKAWLCIYVKCGIIATVAKNLVKLIMIILLGDALC